MTNNRTLIAARVLQALLALVFLAAGGAKLAGTAAMVKVFDEIGVGQWFRVVTGLVEAGSALLMYAPRGAVPGALLLAATMACGAAIHVLVIGGNPVPAVVLMIAALIVAWLRWPELRQARG